MTTDTQTTNINIHRISINSFEQSIRDTKNYVKRFDWDRKRFVVTKQTAMRRFKMKLLHFYAYHRMGAFVRWDENDEWFITGDMKAIEFAIGLCADAYEKRDAEAMKEIFQAYVEL